jgi:hypothetical protein
LLGKDGEVVVFTKFVRGNQRVQHTQCSDITTLFVFGMAYTSSFARLTLTPPNGTIVLQLKSGGASLPGSIANGKKGLFSLLGKYSMKQAQQRAISQIGFPAYSSNHEYRNKCCSTRLRERDIQA